MKNRTVPRRFRNDGLEIIPLTSIQVRARDSIRSKIVGGEYTSAPVICPLCAGTEDSVVAEKDFYGFPVTTVICHSCGMVYANPRLTQDALEKMYATDYRDLDRVRPSSDDYFELERVKARSMEQLVRDNHLQAQLEGKLVVEIGCGAGGGLQYFADLGFSVVGCDLSPRNVIYGKNKGLEVYYGGLDVVIAGMGDRAKGIGLVIYEQVFEHLVDPRGELIKLRNWVPRGALVYIGVPGFKNIGKHYDSDFLRFLQLPHLCHFELRTLVSLAQSEGYVMLCGDESARALFVHTGDIRPVSLSAAQYLDVRQYLKRLEWQRILRLPARVLKAMPTRLGLWSREQVNASTLLPAPVKRVVTGMLKGIYHRFFK